MKCLDKKRIKLKQGETLALNERIMLSMVSRINVPHWMYSQNKSTNLSDNLVLLKKTSLSACGVMQWYLNELDLLSLFYIALS